MENLVIENFLLNSAQNNETALKTVIFFRGMSRLAENGMSWLENACERWEFSSCTWLTKTKKPLMVVPYFGIFDGQKKVYYLIIFASWQWKQVYYWRSLFLELL